MNEDWLWGLIGGLMIGTAAALFLLVNGRIMGASGIVGGLVDGSGRGNAGERLAFIAGIVAVPLLLSALTAEADATYLTGNWIVVIAAGLLVGFGTRVGSGCTSGHGVCGISRLAPRGLVATGVFILAGALTLLVLRHGLRVI